MPGMPGRVKGCVAVWRGWSLGVLPALLLLLGASPAFASEVTGEGRQWLQRSQGARFPAADMRASFEMLVVLSDGSRLSRRGTAYRRNGEGALADRLYVFREPSSLNGLALLSRDRQGKAADQWLYLPAYGRARRVAMHTAGDAFVGSDFYYSDLARVRVEDGTHRLLGERPCAADGSLAGKPACVAVATTDLPGGYPWGSVVNFIDKSNALPRRVEYYDRDDDLARVMTIDRVITVQGFATPLSITMKTVASAGYSTLTLDGISYDLGLEADTFLVEALERGAHVQAAAKASRGASSAP